MSLLVGLVSGNLWVYPESISQGWDASLAHTPYHSLRNEAIDSLEVLNIDVSEIASFFPNYNKIDEIDLNENPKAFTKFSNNSKYIMGNTCKLNFPPIFKLYLSSMNPTTDIKKLIDNIELILLSKLSNNMIENNKITLIATPPV